MSHFAHLPMCDVFASDWDELRVDDAQTTSALIPHLHPDEDYCVKMKSLSFMGDSHFTAPLRHHVFRTGNCTGIYFILLLFPILFGRPMFVEIMQVRRGLLVSEACMIHCPLCNTNPF